MRVPMVGCLVGFERFDNLVQFHLKTKACLYLVVVVGGGANVSERWIDKYTKKKETEECYGIL
jgi:hypothetical protein